MNAPYFESSVLTHFGVSEVFENVIRVALTARRSQRFWITNLRNVKRPMVQKPFCPPKPSPPLVTIPKANFNEDITTLMTNSCMPDAAIKINGKIVLYVHRIVLSSASSIFKKIFTLDSSILLTNEKGEEEEVNTNLLKLTCDQSNDECNVCFLNGKNDCQNITDDEIDCLPNYVSYSGVTQDSSSKLRCHSPTSPSQQLPSLPTSPPPPLRLPVDPCKCNDTTACSTCYKCYVNEVNVVEDEIQLNDNMLLDSSSSSSSVADAKVSKQSGSYNVADESIVIVRPVTPSTAVVATMKTESTKEEEEEETSVSTATETNVTSGICSIGDSNFVSSICEVECSKSNESAEFTCVTLKASKRENEVNECRKIKFSPSSPSSSTTISSFQCNVYSDVIPLQEESINKLEENSFTQTTTDIDSNINESYIKQSSINLQINQVKDCQDTFSTLITTSNENCNCIKSISSMDIDAITEQTNETGISLTSITDSINNSTNVTRWKNVTQVNKSINNRCNVVYKPSRYFNQTLKQLTRSVSDSSISSSVELLRDKDSQSFSSTGSTCNSNIHLNPTTNDCKNVSQVDFTGKKVINLNDEKISNLNINSTIDCKVKLNTFSSTTNCKTNNTNDIISSPSSTCITSEHFEQQTNDNRPSTVKLSTIKNVAAALISSAASSCIPRSATTLIKSNNNNGNQINCCYCSGHKLKVTQIKKVYSPYETTNVTNDLKVNTNDLNQIIMPKNNDKQLQIANQQRISNANCHDTVSNSLQNNNEHNDDLCQCICTSNCNSSLCSSNSNHKFIHFGNRMRSNSWQTLPAFLKQSPSFIQMMEKLTSKIHQQQQLNQQQQQQLEQQQQQQSQQQQSKVTGKSLTNSINKSSRKIDPCVWRLNHNIFDQVSLERSPIYSESYDYLINPVPCLKESSLTCNNDIDVTDDEMYSTGSSDDLVCTRKNCTNRVTKQVSCFGKKLAFNSNCTHTSTNRSVKSSENRYGYTNCRTFTHESDMMTILTLKSNIISEDALKQVINYIYTGSYPDLKFNFNIGQAKEVLYLADLLDIEQLSNSVKFTYSQAKEVIIGKSKVLSENVTGSNSFSTVNESSILNRQLIIDESGISSGYGSSDRINYDYSIRSLSHLSDSSSKFSNCIFEFCDTSKMDYLTPFKSNLANLSINQSLFHDVTFILDDGSLINCHKSILSARCEMMQAMFRGDFLESFSKLIKFPGVSKQTFNQLLYYFYTDSVKCDVNFSNCIKLLELANRLCLIRLVCLVEEKIIHDLTIISEESTDLASETCLALLEPCQIHNCDQLADFCLYYLSVNYKDVSQRQSKILRSLHPENQAYLNRNRWPPIWFQKEDEYYDRCIREREWNEKAKGKGLKRHRINSVCLCFSTKSRKRSKERRKKL